MLAGAYNYFLSLNLGHFLFSLLTHVDEKLIKTAYSQKRVFLQIYNQKIKNFLYYHKLLITIQLNLIEIHEISRFTD